MEQQNLHIKTLIKVCEEERISWQFVSKDEAFIAVKIDSREYPFITTDTPLNSAMTARICNDKGYTFELLQDVVAMPRTLSLIDPDAPPPFQAYASFRNFEPMKEEILKEFTLPLIIKKNSGSIGTNVFKIDDEKRIIPALKTVFNRTSPVYDHVALAQEFIPIAHEYRVTVLNKEIILIYEKDISQATFTGNLSPLHWKGARAVVIDNKTLIARIKKFITPVFSKLNVIYGGFDIAVDNNDKLWLFEINQRPAYNYLVADNGDDVLKDVYRKILDYLKEKE